MIDECCTRFHSEIENFLVQILSRFFLWSRLLENKIKENKYSPLRRKPCFIGTKEDILFNQFCCTVFKINESSEETKTKLKLLKKPMTDINVVTEKEKEEEVRQGGIKF